MGARDKPNVAFFSGALIFAAVAGFVTGSWVMFFIGRSRVSDRTETMTGSDD